MLITRAGRTVGVAWGRARVLVGLLVASVVQGHEMKEITLGARVFPDRIELQIVASPHMANAMLATADTPNLPLDADNFAGHRAALELGAQSLCRLATGLDSPRDLTAKSIDVLRGKDGEILFFLAYPAAGEGPLRIDASALQKIEPDFAAGLTVLDAKRRVLAAKSLTAADANATVLLPTTLSEHTSK